VAVAAVVVAVVKTAVHAELSYYSLVSENNKN